MGAKPAKNAVLQQTMKDFIFTSESVCAGHPDKICDQVSDAIVDAVLEKDPKGRVAVETLVTENKIVLAGEVTTGAKINFEKISRETIKKLGYTNPHLKFTNESPLEIYIHQQSREIAAGVDTDGAGDQGMMFGFACTDTPEYMPMPVTLAHKLAEKIDEARVSKKLPYLRPDGKTQVSVLYKDGQPYKITSVVIAVPHDENKKLKEVKEDIFEQVVKPMLSGYGFSIEPDKLLVNGTGVWHIGGPASDTGVTGRKIVVDTYGGFARVGGGAFSGKDPTKVDRSGAYAARFLAKNIVAAGLADKAEVQLAYCIGQCRPTMQEVETFGTGKVPKKKIQQFMADLLDTSVKGILETLDLRKPRYLKTAAYGHFGREGFPWEQVRVKGQGSRG
ncbi:MAG: methionine adenosyltransferase [Candidatus Levyibacteriota bacterium]